MPRVAKVVLGIIGMAILVLVITFFLGVRLVKKSLPQKKGFLEVRGIQQPVRVFRDGSGVPHIFAENDEDLYFAMGYVVAQDRLWQMDINRRSAMGEMSEIYGKNALPLDKLIHTIGIPDIAKRLKQFISPESKLILDAYARGVNAFITSHFEQLPIEFVLLKYQPEPWKVEHSLAYQRLMAWGLEMAWRVDPVYGQLLEKVGYEKLTEIIPEYWDGEVILGLAHTDKINLSENLFLKLNNEFSNLNELFGSGLGSNRWVVSGKRTKTGKPLLANDPHLALVNPGVWYEIHLHAPGIDCYGVSLPGIPGIVIGRNNAVAWGLTNVMADGCDFFVEKMNPENPDQYLYRGRWFETLQEEREIRVKDEPPVVFKIRSTNQGPIVSDVFPSIRDTNVTISMRWAGFSESDEMRAFSTINRANNWDEFINGLQHFAVPAQNFVFADTAGNVGYYCAGNIPIRRNGTGLVPQPGWTKRYEWKEWIPFGKLPHAFNPSEREIVTANNKVTTNRYPYFISSYWEPTYRATRIHELLAQYDSLETSDFQNIQMDQFSKHGQYILPHILKVLPEFEQSSRHRTFFVNTIKEWNCQMDTRSVGASIFEVFLIQLYENIYRDEMGDDLFQSFLRLPNIPIRVTDRLLAKGASSWFDNIHTADRGETIRDMLLLSLEHTFNFLQTNYGDKIFDWRWGKIHTITFEHPLGKKSPLKSIFNIGPFPIGGSETTINNATFRLDEHRFKTVAGPSMRQVVDLSPKNNSFMITTTGQSAHPLSNHFKDQSSKWLNGEFHPMLQDSVKICTSDFDLLVLKPE